MKKIFLTFNVEDDFEPGTCGDCPISYWDESGESFCPLYCNYENCPMRQLPPAKDLTHFVNSGTLGDLGGILEYNFAQGYNKCLEEIGGNNID